MRRGAMTTWRDLQVSCLPALRTPHRDEHAPTTGLRWNRLLLTGAAGKLGGELRPRLKRYCETLRLSHLEAMGEPGAGEEIVPADLADAAAVDSMVAGVDAIASGRHLDRAALGADPGQQHCGPVQPLRGGAQARGKARRLRQLQPRHRLLSPGRINRHPHRCALMALYGLSKTFGENLAQLYWDRHGIETVSLRIGSSFAEPLDRRMLATWISHDDLERLVVASLSAPVVGHSIIYGVSDNSTSWWDNTHAGQHRLPPAGQLRGFRAAVEARQPRLDRSDPAVIYRGGAFVRAEPDE